jgi:hypothetical protein
LFRGPRVVHALDDDANAIDVEHPQVPAVARTLGVNAGFPWTVDRAARWITWLGFALGDVRRNLKVEVLPGVTGERDVDGRRRVEDGMVRDRVDEVGNGGPDRDVRGYILTWIAQQPGAAAEAQSRTAGRLVLPQPDRPIDS